MRPDMATVEVLLPAGDPSPTHLRARGDEPVISHALPDFSSPASAAFRVYRRRAGVRRATVAIRRRRQHQPRLGAALAVISANGCYAVLALDDLPALLGTPVRDNLRPDLGGAPTPTLTLSPNVCMAVRVAVTGWRVW